MQLSLGRKPDVPRWEQHYFSKHCFTKCTCSSSISLIRLTFSGYIGANGEVLASCHQTWLNFMFLICKTKELSQRPFNIFSSSFEGFVLRLKCFRKLVVPKSNFSSEMFKLAMTPAQCFATQPALLHRQPRQWRWLRSSTHAPSPHMARKGECVSLPVGPIDAIDLPVCVGGWGYLSPFKSSPKLGFRSTLVGSQQLI